MKGLGAFILRLTPLLVLLLAWQLYSQTSPRARFLYASPSMVADSIREGFGSGVLLSNTIITGGEALIGFILGVTIGTFAGFALLFFPFVSAIARPYIFALGSIPVFALAPMFIIWFGVGFSMKVALAFFSTVLVATAQAYEGGNSVSSELQELFVLNGSSRGATFRKLIFPSAMNWVLASLRLNIGLALLGTVIGEFIASERGLGHQIIKASGLYDTPQVLAATLCIIGLAFLFGHVVGTIEHHRLAIIERLTVPKILWGNRHLKAQTEPASQSV